jgi:hypothetical protein
MSALGGEKQDDLFGVFNCDLQKGMLNRRSANRLNEPNMRLLRVYLLSVYAFRKKNRRERGFYEQYLQLHKEQFKTEPIVIN